MSMDDGEDGPKDLRDSELEAVQGGAGLWFGEYAVIGPGVQIVLDGRTVSLPND